MIGRQGMYKLKPQEDKRGAMVSKKPIILENVKFSL